MRAEIPLTESLCRKALPREKNYKLTDGDGLYLLNQTNGMRYWRMNYREGGKQRTAVFGGYPEVSLNDARIRTFDLRRQLKEGKAAAAANCDTFEVVAREWFSLRKPAWKPSQHERVGARVERDLIAPLGDMAIADITTPKLLAVLREVEARGAMEIVKRVRQHADQIFAYALVTGRVERNVAADLRGAMTAPPRVKHMAALREKDLPEFFGRLRNYDGEEQTRLAVEFVVHTFVRTNEMRFARWSEFEVDLWCIPAERMKMGREHIVPLTARSQAILRRLRELADGSEWIAPA